MANKSFYDYPDIEKFLNEFKCGVLNDNKLSLTPISGHVLEFYGFKKLSIDIDEKSHSCEIKLIEGSFTEIKTPQNIKINLKDVEVESLVCKGECAIDGSTIQYCQSSSLLQIKNCTIHKLEHDHAQLGINSSKINHIVCIRSSLLPKFNMMDVSHFEIIRYRPTNPIELTLKFNKNSEFHILSCDLEKVNLVDCDFTGTILYSHNSILKLSGYYNTKWFKKIRRLKETEKSKLIPQDECRQLKLSAIDAKNNIDADIFRAFELHAHFQSLKLFSNRFDSKVTLALNLVSNRFERSWFIPLMWILGFGFIMFVAYFYSSNLWKTDQAFLLDYIKLYWIFINPLHGFEMLGPDKATGWSLFIDTFHRVFNSYFIYQLVAAFRRFKIA